jgi:hypothetical protein
LRFDFKRLGCNLPDLRVSEPPDVRETRQLRLLLLGGSELSPRHHTSYAYAADNDYAYNF